MNKLLLNEWLKLKKSGLLIISVITVVIIPVVIGSMVIILNSNPAYEAVSFLEFMGMNLRLITKTSGLCLFTYIAAEMLTREFRYDTFKSQFLMPVTRSYFLLIKLIGISIWLLAITMATYLVSLIISVWLIQEPISFLMVREMFFVFLKAGILILPFAYFTITLVIIFKNNFIPMTINIVLYLVTLITIGLNQFIYLPWTAPFRLIFSGDVQDTTAGQVSYTYLSLFLFAAISILIGHYWINKMEL